MDSLDAIYQRAVKRHGGEAILSQRLAEPKSRAALRRLGDDRILAEMSRAVFQAGFVWRVIQNKWAGFEEAFRGFDPKKVARLSDAQLDKLRNDARIVRNPVKIRATRDNALWLVALAKEHGSAARWIADYPEEEVIAGLWPALQRHGSRLGGFTGQFFLRHIGKDTPMMTGDVMAALRRQGVVTTRSVTSKKALAAVQDAFNTWRNETGRSLTAISRILACSEGEVRSGHEA